MRPRLRRTGRRGPGGALGADFARLWTAVSISTVGDGVSVVAYPWLASTLTRNAAAIALVPVALRLPWLVVSLPAGVLIDRVDRQRLIIGVDVVRAGVTAGVAVGVATSTMSLPLLLVLLLVLGTGEVLASNASLALLPSVVAPDALERANGRLQASDVVANGVIGPPLAGVLIALALTTPFALDAASFAASAVLVATLRLRPAVPAPPVAAGGADSTPHRMRSDIAEDLRWLWAHPTLRLLALTLGVMNMLFSMATSTEVLFARETLGLGSLGFGLLFTGGAVGGVLGSVVAAPLVARIGVPRMLQLSLISESLSVLIYGLSPVAWVTGSAIALFAFTGIIWNVVTMSLRQRLIPDRLLGRVGSVYRLLGVGMAPLGAAAGGFIVVGAGHLVTRHLALRAPMLVASVGYALLLLVVLPRMGRLARDQSSPGHGGPGAGDTPEPREALAAPRA